MTPSTIRTAAFRHSVVFLAFFGIHLFDMGFTTPAKPSYDNSRAVRDLLLG